MHTWFLVLVLISKELRNALEAQQVFFGHVCWALPHRARNYRIESNFWKFYLIKIGFKLHEPVSLVIVFRPFKLEWIFWVFQVWTQLVDVQHLIYWQGQRVCDALF